MINAYNTMSYFVQNVLKPFIIMYSLFHVFQTDDKGLFVYYFIN